MLNLGSKLTGYAEVLLFFENIIISNRKMIAFWRVVIDVAAVGQFQRIVELVVEPFYRRRLVVIGIRVLRKSLVFYRNGYVPHELLAIRCCCCCRRVV